MRRMFSKKQVEELSKEITKQNSTQLYKHSLTYSYTEGVNPPPDAVIIAEVINNDPTNYTHTITEDDLGTIFSDGEPIIIVSRDKCLFSTKWEAVNDEASYFYGPGIILFGSLDGSGTAEDPYIYDFTFMDFEGDANYTFLSLQDDERYVIGAQIKDTVTKL